MANHKSALKRNRQRVVNTSRHRGRRSNVRTILKLARAAIADGHEDAAALVKRATSLLDRAAQKNALPIRRASRVKGRLAAALYKLTAGKTAAAD